MNTAKMTAEILALDEWTQTRLANHFGVSQGTVSRWLKGTDPEGPNRDKLRELHSRIVTSTKDAAPDQAARAALLAAFDALEDDLKPIALKRVLALVPEAPARPVKRHRETSG